MRSPSEKDKALDRKAAIPLYHQIFLQLRDEILSGQRACGTLVATEQDLSRNYAVSRITARRALDELANNHFVTRKRRVGTTVTFRPPAKPIEANIEQTLDSLLQLGRATKVRVLRVGREPVTPTVAEALHVKPGTEVIRAVRVRYLDGEALGYVVSYVPAALGRYVTRATLSKTPILEVIRKAGYRLGKATQTIAAVLADPVLCSALHVEPRSAILRISRVSFDHAGDPVLVTFAHYRSDRYQLRIDLQS